MSDTFSAMETSFDFPWPKSITGLERITLTSPGNLQRTLSVYFGKPITVEQTWQIPASGAIESASPEHPITKVREVTLSIEGKAVCLCISNITMTTPRAARLFLEEKHAVDQMYRMLGRNPEFTLVNVGIDENISGGQQLWRSYKLATEGFECEIREIFPDRRIFSGECWDKIAGSRAAALPAKFAPFNPINPENSASLLGPTPSATSVGA
ncbi:hypothetical protein FRB94_010774 [Tulasnella sp. JGI-2019a]|nr:hypothetical protein FRB93_013912 [Tulasnella sp. JGI-2019a]KAG9010246.1 hypothetical protein FRB94_010774 [Tulasnella sp. JGI-2019a]KAG9035912.1 hypothetical protein FRB95_010315 [Tulasnella sp. JGI-2019a]